MGWLRPDCQGAGNCHLEHQITEKQRFPWVQVRILALGKLRAQGEHPGEGHDYFPVKSLLHSLTEQTTLNTLRVSLFIEKN